SGAGVGAGLWLKPNGSSSFAVTNTMITDNSSVGIFVGPQGAGGAAVGVLDRVGLYKNGNGLQLVGSVNFTVTDSVASGSVGAFNWGFSAHNGARLLLQRSVAVSNGVGIFAGGGGSLVIVNQSVVYNNAQGWVASLANGGPPTGQIASYGNNVVCC